MTTTLLDEDDLAGIWKFGASDVRAEGEWLYRVANTLVQTLSLRTGGRSVSIPRDPRRAGFNVYDYHFAADLAQCLRYARSEAELDMKYFADTLDVLAIILKTRALDLADVASTEARIGQVPVPDLDFRPLEGRRIGAIILAAQGRRLLQQGNPIPSVMAEALTGWTEHRILHFRDEQSEVVMKHTRRKSVVYFEATSLDHLLKCIEEVFFYAKRYTPL